MACSRRCFCLNPYTMTLHSTTHSFLFQSHYYGGPKVSRQFQLHGNFNFTTAISTSFTAISILSRHVFFMSPWILEAITIWVITHNADGAHCLWRDVSWRSTLIELWRDVLWTLWCFHNNFTTVLHKLWIR